MQIWVPSNPRGAETLPPKIISSESDLYVRRLWGNPSEVCIPANYDVCMNSTSPQLPLDISYKSKFGNNFLCASNVLLLLELHTGNCGRAVMLS